MDFLGSYPPGDMVLGELRGPMREETEQWLNRICMDLPTQHATAAEAHNRLMLTKAFDKSARLKKPVPLPITEVFADLPDPRRTGPPQDPLQVADELEGFDFERAQARVARIFDTTRSIFELADQDGVPPAVAADHLAERRMTEISRLRRILLSNRR